MKSIEVIFSFFLALALAAGFTMLYSQAGYGAAGTLILGSILATAIFSILGGRLRVLLVAIAVAPPFIAALLDNYSSARESLEPWDALRNIFPYSVLGFGLIVFLPILLVFIVYHFTYRRGAGGHGGPA